MSRIIILVASYMLNTNCLFSQGKDSEFRGFDSIVVDNSKVIFGMNHYIKLGYSNNEVQMVQDYVGQYMIEEICYDFDSVGVRIYLWHGSHNPRQISIKSPVDTVGKIYYFDDVNQPSRIREIAEGFSVKNGKATIYYPDGKVEREVHYKDSKLHGLYTWYYPSGMVYKIENYNEGAVFGTICEYREDGTILSIARAVNGRLHGSLYYYNEKGDIRIHEVWDNGELIRETKYE